MPYYKLIWRPKWSRKTFEAEVEYVTKGNLSTAKTNEKGDYITKDGQIVKRTGHSLMSCTLVE